MERKQTACFHGRGLSLSPAPACLCLGDGRGDILVSVSLVVFPAGHSVSTVPQGLLHSVLRTMREFLNPGRACLLAHIPALFCFLNMLPFKDLPPFVLPL